MCNMESSSNPLEADFLSTHRLTILEKLKDALGGTPVPPIIWAFLWVADLKCLVSLMLQARKDQKSVAQAFNTFHDYFKALENDVSEDECSSRPEECDKECLNRDQNRCILTNAGKPVEICIMKLPEMKYQRSTDAMPFDIWSIMRHFWSKTQCDIWKNATLQGCNNSSILITMSPNAHCYWVSAYFVLKPLSLSEDRKTLKVQFFWLKHTYHREKHVDLLQVPSLPDNLDHGPRGVKLFDNRTEKKVRSGDIITMTTLDPETNPLPNKDVLEMQWVINRVFSLTGTDQEWGRDEEKEDEEKGDDDFEHISSAEVDG